MNAFHAYDNRGSLTTSPGVSVVLAAGGTGGHVFPAQALAETLLARGVHVVVMTDNRSAKYAHAFAHAELHTITSGTVSGSWRRKLFGAFNMAKGMLQAYQALTRLRPQAVVGFGGYPSFPTVWAGAKLGIPCIIHEQNAVLGRANRMLAAKVHRIATSFAQVSGLSASQHDKITVTGNPVRSAICALHTLPYPALSAESTLHILVLGGSQGASIFSRVLPEALALLPVALRSRIRIDQQCRPEDLDATSAAYHTLGISADLDTFFTDVPSRLASAHLVITRAGASTVAELAAAGKPAILIPFAGAMDQHQHHNANAVEEAGGGWLMPEEACSAQAIAARLENILNLPERLPQMAEHMRSIARLDAAEKLADLLTPYLHPHAPSREEGATSRDAEQADTSHHSTAS